MKRNVFWGLQPVPGREAASTITAHIYTRSTACSDGNGSVSSGTSASTTARSRPDYAEIKGTVDSLCGPGEIDLVRPYEIHREVNTGERAVAVIIRSEKSGGFNQGRYEPGEQPLL